MAKKKAAPKFTYTGNDVDQASVDGFLEGMAETHGIVYDVIDELIRSVENVQAVYYLGDVFGKKTAKVEELQTVIDAFAHLKDVFENKYFETLDEHREIARKMEAIHTAADFGLTIE
jgi:hypothetical protein